MKPRQVVGAFFVCLACLSGEPAAAKTKAINIIVIDSDDSKVGVASAVLSGTATLAQEATTDGTGKLRLPRECKPGELIQANPIEEIVYEPSGPVACTPDLRIEVRRRPFVNSGVVVFSVADFKAPSGENRLAITKVALDKKTRNIVGLSNQVTCEIALQPMISTVVYENLDDPAAIKTTFSQDAAWSDFPRTINLSTECNDSAEQIKALTDEYAQLLVSKATTESIGSNKWLKDAWKDNSKGVLLEGISAGTNPGLQCVACVQ